MDDFKENVIEFLVNEKTATVTFSQGRYVSKIRELAEKRPNDCKIVAENENSIVAHIPTSWVKIIASRELTDEQIEAYRERARQMNKFKKKGDE